jgi:hypothetical protein
MSDWMTSDITQAFLNQRVTLWLGPHYGWQKGDPEAERPCDNNDNALARAPWRAIYSESPVPVLEEAISELEKHVRQEDRSLFRRPYVVASPGADDNLVLTQFLPVYYLNGRLRAGNRENAWRELPERLRAAYRSSMILSIRNIPQEEGVLLLIGFDLDSLKSTLEEVQAFIGDASPVVVLSPPEGAAEVIESCPRVVSVDLTPADFIAEVEARGLLAPVDQELTAHIIVGSVRIRIDDLLQGPMGRLDESFRVVTAEALTPPSRIDRELFDSFMVLNETRDARNVLQDRREWAGFTSGFSIERNYRVANEKSLFAFVLSKLKESHERTDGIRNLTIDLPAHPGAGATTLLHHVASQCAAVGFPAFVLKQDTTDVPFGQLSDVLTDISQRRRDAIREIGKVKPADAKVDHHEEQEVPCILIFDVPHSEMDDVLVVAHRLAASGRRCLVLRAIPTYNEVTEAEDDDRSLDVKRVRGPSERLPALTARLSDSEIHSVQEHFDALRRNHDLPLMQRIREDWHSYQKQSFFKVLPQGSMEEAESLFWVVLHYFVTSTDVDWSTDGVHSCIAKRLQKLSEDDPLCVKTLLDIARFSINGLYVDWQHLGRLEGNTFSTEVLRRTRKLEDQQLVRFRWEEGAGANLFRLHHRLMARLFLQEAVSSRTSLLTRGVPEEAIPAQDDLFRPLWMLVPYLKVLDGSVPGDVRLAEEISAGALRVSSQRELSWRYREDILAAFEKIPDIIRSSSRAINHHYAMALWKTAGYDQLQDNAESERRFTQAVELLEEALTIPARTHERDEHPGHILTTRAYVRWRWAMCISGAAQRAKLETEAVHDFRTALRELPDNRYATYGLARALITICEAADSVLAVGSKAEMIGEALDLLQGDPSPDFAFKWQALQESAIIVIDDSAPAHFRANLRDNNEEAGYLLEAWSELGGSLGNANNEKKMIALNWLQAAIDDSKTECTWRTHYLAYKIYRMHPKYINDFHAQYKLLRILEGISDFILKTSEIFDLGVLCYQLDIPQDGAKLLRRLRISGAYRDINLSFQPWWTEIEPPFRPRAATLRVKRVISLYNGWGYVPELEEEVPFSPSHFDSREDIPVGKNLRCYIRFSGSGAKAVPERFYRSTKS